MKSIKINGVERTKCKINIEFGDKTQIIRPKAIEYKTIFDNQYKCILKLNSNRKKESEWFKSIIDNKLKFKIHVYYIDEFNDISYDVIEGRFNNDSILFGYAEIKVIELSKDVEIPNEQEMFDKINVEYERSK